MVVPIFSRLWWWHSSRIGWSIFSILWTAFFSSLYYNIFSRLWCFSVSCLCWFFSLDYDYEHFLEYRHDFSLGASMYFLSKNITPSLSIWSLEFNNIISSNDTEIDMWGAVNLITKLIIKLVTGGDCMTIEKFPGRARGFFESLMN